ncbi:B12-binding domain-containing radical SAM protein [Nisaea sp.]|uniref:B12-binding domain-containing radical SAM protein n=1 Tax=Nisaea sp. TaxID=2024842 RepID=UPI003B5252F5
MARKLDVLFVNPNSAKAAYQALSNLYSAIEPPTWSLLLAAAMRKQGYGVEILDCEALHLDPERAAQEISDRDPRLVCFVMYGQNPNSGTTSMIGAIELGTALRDARPDLKTCFIGSHPSALPREVLAYDFVDFVFINEGVYGLQQLLSSDLKTGMDRVEGLGFKTEDGHQQFGRPGRLVPQDRMDEDLPGYAWDLLPYDKKPLDLYRAHFWHTNFSHEGRTPFAAIYTSLGCRFGCDFCMINIVNRTETDDNVSAADSRVMRHWSPQFILKEFEALADLGVETLRISDEMFFLNRKYYQPILEGIIDRGLKFNMWAYARVDTIRPDQLELFKKAGTNWLCLGIEAGNKKIRKTASKGRFEEVDIQDVVRMIQQHDINVLGNYIFGLPDDTHETMQETLDLALELNTEHANFYPCQALPGSPLHLSARLNGWELPQTYEEYAFLSYACKPLPTHHLSASDVLRFRDEAWTTYFTNERFLSLVEQKFGPEQKRNIEEMAKIKLKRKLLEDAA